MVGSAFPTCVGGSYANIASILTAYSPAQVYCSTAYPLPLGTIRFVADEVTITTVASTMISTSTIKTDTILVTIETDTIT
jgi:hypothetical protein